MPRTSRILFFMSLCLLAPLPSKAGAPQNTSADTAYFEAKKAYALLKADARRRQFRDKWMKVAERFEKVAQKYPRSQRAPQALYNAANLYSDLSRVSLANRDLRLAIETYQKLAKTYPRSSLADDAYLAIGLIYRDRQGDINKAETAFRAAIACKDDLRPEAQAALSSLTSYRQEKPKEKREIASIILKNGLAKSDASSKVAASADEEEAEENDDEEEEESASYPAPAEASKNLRSDRVKALKKAARNEIPLSVQVGLKIKRIIIDPGHGGHDSGAVGRAGALEKTVTLEISKKLKERLEKDGFEVFLTRNSDQFVSLESRARFANRKKGDLFLSIHCNAHKNRKLRGVETYTLNVTSDRYSIRLAARENATSERSVSDLQFVLADLATKANTADSSNLARSIQSQLISGTSGEKKSVRNLGVKQALFYVLLGVRMPSVLVETAFISNPLDENRLSDPQKQASVAQAIANGVNRFIAEREAIARGDW